MGAADEFGRLWGVSNGADVQTAIVGLGSGTDASASDEDAGGGHR